MQQPTSTFLFAMLGRILAPAVMFSLHVVGADDVVTSGRRSQSSDQLMNTEKALQRLTLDNSIASASVDYNEEDFAKTVSQLFQDVVAEQLPGCYVVILYKENDDEQQREKLNGILSDLVENWKENIILWELEDFLSSASPEDLYVYRYSHLKTKGVFCILYVALADLKAVGRVFLKVQHGTWFQGATKYMLVYTGSAVDIGLLEADPILGESYNLVVVSEAEHPGENVTERADQDQLEFQFYQTCPYCNDGNPRVNYIAHWKGGCGFLFSQPFYPDLFQRFNGHLFQAVTLVYEPFSCYEKLSDDILIPTGNCVDNTMLHEMSLTLNFTYKFTEPSDGQWGHKLDNGSYTGVIGSVERMEADFSLNIAITQDREEVVDCTIGYHIEPITFATTNPRPLNQAFAIIRPFRAEVWIAFGLTIIAAGPTYYTISAYAAKSSNIPTPPTLAKACLRTFAACFNQSVKWLSVSSARLFTATYLFSMYVTVTMYVAMLTASLTLPTLSPTLNTLEELVESDFSWGIQDLGAADYQLLKSSKVPLYQRVFKGLEQCPSLDECIVQARDTNYAFITWRTYLEDRIAVRYTSSAGERQLHVASGDIFPVELGWAMNPGSPYRHVFNSQIRAQLESGLISKWLKDVINDPKRREGNDDEVALSASATLIQALGLHHLQGVFFIFTIGCVSSCMFFIFELTLCKRKTQSL